ncbi:MAG: diacylglycerol kinase family lipid kinase [Caulobacteraceae bacterium]|nr:diacylglycerol kinase family lipid kinase [Caulobacteraceae bacterium]
MTDVGGAPSHSRKTAAKARAVKAAVSRLTPHVPLRHVEVVVNPMSGSVGPRAAVECESFCQTFQGVRWNITEAGPANLDQLVHDAVAAKPDLVVVLAGDGTARSAATLAGPEGPLVAPLPGGTMNMLPKALYGTADWKEALRLALTQGVVRPVAGGELDGFSFYCAAIVGAPALWAPAREAVRSGAPRLAWLYAKRAMKRAFAGRIRFRLDDGEICRGEALTLISPLISRALESPVGLESAVMNLKGASEVFRLAANAVFSDWRADPAVVTTVVKRAEVWAAQEMPAILDGESVRLGRKAIVKFVPCAFRTLAPRVANPAVSLAPEAQT